LINAAMLMDVPLTLAWCIKATALRAPDVVLLSAGTSLLVLCLGAQNPNQRSPLTMQLNALMALTLLRLQQFLLASHTKFDKLFLLQG
jgi:hypothetical protein